MWLITKNLQYVDYFPTFEVVVDYILLPITII